MSKLGQSILRFFDRMGEKAAERRRLLWHPRAGGVMIVAGVALGWNVKEKWKILAAAFHGDGRR
jgi:hypothetical protein